MIGAHQHESEEARAGDNRRYRYSAPTYDESDVHQAVMDDGMPDERQRDERGQRPYMDEA
jgi:hypothetical protein